MVEHCIHSNNNRAFNKVLHVVDQFNGSNSDPVCSLFVSEYICVCLILHQPPGGSSNVWDLVSVINGQDDSLLPASYSKGVMHMKHLLKFKTVRSSYTDHHERAHCELRFAADTEAKKCISEFCISLKEQCIHLQIT